MQDRTSELLALTSTIVRAHLEGTATSAAGIGDLIGGVHAALSRLGTVPTLGLAPPPRPEPAVPVRSSVKPDYIICLEDGRKMKMLKRHLMVSFGLTPAAYREKWGLACDYPMVAPNYAMARRDIALGLGLGRKPKAEPLLLPEPPVALPVHTAPKRRKLGIAISHS